MNPAANLELGPRTHLARMTYAWRILSVLPVAAWTGLMLVVAATTKQPLHKDPEFGLILIVTAVLAIPAIIVWIWHRTLEVSLHENGISRKSFSTVVSLPWSQVLYVRYRAVRIRVHGVAVG